MKKQITDILYNPGSVQTCHQDRQVSYIGLEDRDTEVLKVFETLVVASHEVSVEQGLEQLQQEMLAGVSSGMRLIILREFNSFLERVGEIYKQSASLFETSLQTILMFKALIDSQDTQHSSMAQEEWIELERSLYLLSQWEDGLQVEQGLSGIVLQ